MDLGQSTGWSINNSRTILNCSHFLARRYFSNPFSPKWSIHTGKLSQQHEFVMASFVILLWCHFVSPYNMGGSANSNMGGSANSVLSVSRPSFLENRQGKRSLNLCKSGLHRKKLSQSPSENLGLC